MFAYIANSYNFGRWRRLFIYRSSNDRNVVGSMPVLDINANYLTGTLCGVED